LRLRLRRSLRLALPTRWPDGAGVTFYDSGGRCFSVWGGERCGKGECGEREDGDGGEYSHRKSESEGRMIE
jgi:hypothetical protein